MSSANACRVVDTTTSPFAALRSLPIELVKIIGGFWEKRQRVNADTAIPHGYRKLHDVGCVNNIAIAAGRAQGEFQGQTFHDSDAYKWLEAAACEYARRPNDDLMHQMDELIDLLKAAQMDDGYLNTFFQIKAGIDQRWRNLRDEHELYCAGHLMQAAAAHHRATGKSNLLDIAVRFADCIDQRFGPDKQQGVPGHPVIEMALIELFRVTGEKRHLDLALHFINQRGRGVIGGSPQDQDHQPIREKPPLTGHAVRQLYLAAGVMDACLETNDRELAATSEFWWEDLVNCKLYITGGAGSRHQQEAFGLSYELPNDRAYAETCAAIAAFMWAWRFLLARGQRRCADLMEQCLYNNILAGISLDGGKYFYVNLLHYVGPDRAAPHTRFDWHRCACCPPNLMRTLAALGHYLATTTDHAVQLHLYAAANIDTPFASLAIDTEYPWDGKVAVTLEEVRNDAFSLEMRVPEWCDEHHLRVNDQVVEAAMNENGYLVIQRRWRVGDCVTLDLSMKPRMIAAHPAADAPRGCVALQRGPVVYCLEQADMPNGVDPLQLAIDLTHPQTAMHRDDLLDGVTVLQVTARPIQHGPALYRELPTLGEPRDITAIPYFAWNNRQCGAMCVWIPVAPSSP